MKKYKYLLKNMGLLTISNFGSKVLSFLLVPLYTSLLTTSEYGTYDLYVVTISLLTPILSLSIVNGVMRFTLDKDSDKTQTFSIGLIGSTRAVIIFIAMVAVNYIFNIIPTFNEYPLYFILYFASSIYYSLIASFARGLDKVTDYAVAGLIDSAVMLSLNVLFLAVLHMGLSGYFLANCLSKIIPIVYLMLRLRVYKYIRLTKMNKSLKQDMERYSKPLIFNTIAWWINNVSDRYIVTWLCGTSANGIYSVAYKIPSVINVFQSIFSEAWTLSAVKEYDEGSEDFYTEVYNLYNFGLVFVCSALIVADQLCAKILFAKDFYTAWQYAPFLMISVLFGALSGLIGGIFSAAKDSKIFAKTTVAGACVNTVLNIALVYFMGPVGAAIATLVSYFLVWIARVKSVKKLVTFNINLKKDFTAYLLLLAQAIIMVTVNIFVLKYIIEFIILIVIVVIYFKETKIYIQKIMDAAKKLFSKKSKDDVH